MRTILWILLLLAATVVQPACAQSRQQRYITSASTCDGWPRLPIEMAEGYCAGQVLGPPPPGGGKRQIRTPRMLLSLGENRWLLSDLGNWTPLRGAVWLLETEGKPAVNVRKLLGDMLLPHTLAIGPDGKVYVGEMSRIVRFDPAAANPASTVEVVIGNLPDNRLHENRHPLSHFIFDGNNDLLVNVGAATDQCLPAAGATAVECEASKGPSATAVIRRYKYRGSGQWDPQPSILAYGLRNSLVLLRHRSGTLLQAENSYDYAPNADQPYEEVNVLRNGAHYGWPYCADIDTPTPGWSNSNAMKCNSADHEKPVLLLPPHSAPLGATYYDGAMFPALRGKLLMTWHGYRATGSRVVAFDVDAKGVPVRASDAKYPVYSKEGVLFKPYSGPAAQPTVLTTGWDLRAGLRPAGAPLGVTVARDGAIWVTDDRNATIVRIAVDRP